MTLRPGLRVARWLLVGGLAATGCSRATAPVPADLILTGGRVYTLEPDRPWAEALAIRGSRIVSVGREADVRALRGPATRVIPLGGRFVMPAFRDAHVHPYGAGLELGLCNLNDLRDAETVLATIRQCAVAQAGRPWITGGGWDLPVFPPGHPTAADLDAVTGDTPTAFSSADGHTLWVNSAALRAANLSARTPDPEAGRIERDAAGRPTGLLREEASSLVSRLVPPPSPDEARAGLLRALAAMHKVGIVAFHEAGARESTVEAYRALARAGQLTARVRLALATDPTAGPEQVERLVRLRATVTEAGLRADSVKIFVDGVLEAGTAYVLEPYVPMPGQGAPTNPRGLPNFTDAALAALVTRLDREGFQIHMHAIGDAAIRQGLDAIEAAVRLNGPRDRRPHLAHIQLFHPDEIGRFASLGVVANMQALWAFPDAYVTDLTNPRLGPERAARQYPFAALKAAGARLAGGSDWSVSSVNPLEAIQVGVTRRALEAPADAPSWLPDQRLDVATMLAAYTTGGAYVSFEEQESGTLAPGQLADVIVLDRNLLDVPVTDIHRARVLRTFFEGREVYRAEGVTP